MNIKLDYTVRGKFTSHYFSGEVYVHITKKEARFVARRHFIWENSIERLDYPYDYDAIETVLKRGTEKARQAILDRVVRCMYAEKFLEVQGFVFWTVAVACYDVTNRIYKKYTEEMKE